MTTCEKQNPARWHYPAGVLIWALTVAMHIPDGYLSPITAAVMVLLVLPFWVIGLRRIGSHSGTIPLVALMAAFSFVIMMFNVPLPGGTSGHAVGAALAGIVLGPGVAVIAISLALFIQALFFGDGGLLAIGANCFNIAVIVPFVAVSIYRRIAGDASMTSRRRPLAAGIGGWAGLTTAALLAGVEFGLQPLLFRAADGVPQYAPYPLSVAVPAMVIPHALLASVIEGLLTALIIVYLQRSNLHVLETAAGNNETGTPAGRLRLRWLWIGLIAFAAATPLGLLAPGTAWGEWTTTQLAERGLQPIPEGFARLSDLWGAPLSEYSVPGLANASLGYLLSAFLGVLIIVLLTWLYTAVTASNGSSR